MKELIFILLMTLCMAGCGVMGPRVNTVHRLQAPNIEPDNKSAVVYVIRPWYSFGAGRNIQIYKDEKPLCVLKNGSYFIHRTVPGQHFYRDDKIEVQTELIVEAG